MKFLNILTVFICVGMLVFSGTLLAQNSEELLDDYSRISLNVFVPDDSPLTPTTRKLLTGKLQQIVARQGMGGEGTDPRFIITGNAFELTKDILGTAPPMHAVTLEVTFYIGDGIEGKLFSTHSKTVRGVGSNPTKAEINALKNIKSSDPEFEAFIESAKAEILAYYNTQCEFILKESRAQFDQREFDEAVLTLMQVPQVCTECFDKAMAMTTEIQLARMEYECQTNINQSKAAIAKEEWEKAADFIALYTPDFECYSEVKQIITQITDHQCMVYLGKAKAAWNARDAQLAGSFLGNIAADTECSDDANALGRQIAASLDAAARKRWELAYEKYNRNQNLKEQKAANDMDLANRQQTQSELNAENQRELANRRQTESELDGANDRELANRRQTENEKDAASRRDLADREMAYKEEYGFQLEKARIKAARDVGVAYGKNQPKTKVTYNVVGWY